MPIKKLVLAGLIVTVVIFYFAADGDELLSIGLFKDLFNQSPFGTAIVFFLIYFVGTSCSLPVAGVLSVVSGIIFGLATGFLISLVACTLGGTIALLSTRFLFHDLIKRRFSVRLDVINKGLEKEGAFYLFGLRMVPVIPFWLLNLLVGLTTMRVPLFFVATFSGMIPIILILVYTGSRLGNIETFSMAAIFDPGLILSLCLLAVFPFLARAIVKFTRRYAKSKAEKV
jgi:uncharacterized membrane protein YdjX (TVP38/TMEM64 family)